MPLDGTLLLPPEGVVMITGLSALPEFEPALPEGELGFAPARAVVVGAPVVPVMDWLVLTPPAPEIG